MTPALLPPCLLALRRLFPDADPGFLSQAILHHLAALDWLEEEADNKRAALKLDETARRIREDTDVICVQSVVQRVVQKMLENGGEGWPRIKLKQRKGVEKEGGDKKESGMSGKGKDRDRRVGEVKTDLEEQAEPLCERDSEPAAVDETLTRNAALVRLHSIFPSTPIPTLRQLLLAFPHSYLHQTIEHLLAHPDLANPPPPPPSAKHNAALNFLLAPFRSRSRTPSASSSEAGDDAHPSLPTLLPSDLLHSTAYIPYLTSHLQKTFPSVPAAVLKSFIADEVPYREMRRRVEEWKEIKGRGWRGFWGRLGGGGEKGKGKGKAREEDEEDANEEDVRELMEEIKAWDREHWPSEIAPVVVQREEEGKAGPSRRRSTSSSSSMDAELYPEADDLPLPDLPPWPSSSAPSFADLDLDLVAEAPIPSSLLPLPQPGPEPIEPDLDCQCCFSPLDPPFSSLSTAESSTISCLSRTDPHLFCAPCLRRQVEEHLFGGAPLALASTGLGREQGVRCMSISGCRAGFEARDLKRVLGGKRWRMLERRVAEAAVEALVAAASRVGGRSEEGVLVEGARRIVRCPAQGCPYAEEREDPNPFSNSFPFWTSPLAAQGLWWSAQGVDALFFSLYSVLVLSFLHAHVLVAILFLPQRFTPPRLQPALFPLIEPQRALRACKIWIHELALAVLARKEGAPNLLRCRNTPDGNPLRPFGEGVEGLASLKEVRREVWPCLQTRWQGGAGGSAAALMDEHGDGGEEEQLYCGLISCLLCAAPVMPERGAHRCYSEEKDGLRLAVERARSEAVKRVCGRCGLSFVKEGGCNKMSCRCGATSCFVCRQEITSTEGYTHFCQHFRATLGECTECTKCNLWKNIDDDQAAAAAAQAAQERWVEERAGGIKIEVQEQQIGPVLDWEDWAFVKVQRVCESLLGSIVY